MYYFLQFIYVACIARLRYALKVISDSDKFFSSWAGCADVQLAFSSFWGSR
jgi:hypothetical protein